VNTCASVSPSPVAFDWGPALARASSMAKVSLEQMTGRTLAMHTEGASAVPFAQVPCLAGSPESPLTVVHVLVEGGADGQAMLCLRPEGVAKCVSLLLGRPHVGKSHANDLLGLSALAEAGNVALSAFLNVLADGLGIALRPSVPVVVTDMAGAIFSSALAAGGVEGNEAVVVRASFGDMSMGIEGFLVYLPARRYRHGPDEIPAAAADGVFAPVPETAL
jgi:chemotaxis protein CheC